MGESIKINKFNLPVPQRRISKGIPDKNPHSWERSDTKMGEINYPRAILHKRIIDVNFS